MGINLEKIFEQCVHVYVWVRQRNKTIIKFLITILMHVDLGSYTELKHFVLF